MVKIEIEITNREYTTLEFEAGKGVGASTSSPFLTAEELAALQVRDYAKGKYNAQLEKRMKTVTEEDLATLEK